MLVVMLGLCLASTGCVPRTPPEVVPASTRRAPDVVFVPTPFAVVDQMLAVARVGAGDVLYDLGSGDGRIVIAAAKRFGIRAVGIDIDPKRIEESRENADTAGVTDKVEFRQADLFTTDLRTASVVTLYLLPELNVRLRPKLFAELRPGSRVVSHSFDMGDWRADSTMVVDARLIYFWVVPADISGRWTVVAAVDGSERRQEIRFAQKYQRVTAADAGSGRTIDTAMVAGDNVRFVMSDRSSGDAVVTVFRGKVAGDSMTGIFARGATSGSWRATRRAPR